MKPSNTTSHMFFYVYVLESLQNGERYIGYSSNLKRRLEEHNKGKTFTTKFMTPFKLIYFDPVYQHLILSLNQSLDFT